MTRRATCPHHPGRIVDEHPCQAVIDKASGARCGWSPESQPELEQTLDRPPLSLVPSGESEAEMAAKKATETLEPDMRVETEEHEQPGTGVLMEPVEPGEELVGDGEGEALEPADETGEETTEEAPAPLRGYCVEHELGVDAGMLCWGMDIADEEAKGCGEDCEHFRTPVGRCGEMPAEDDEDVTFAGRVCPLNDDELCGDACEAWRPYTEETETPGGEDLDEPITLTRRELVQAIRSGIDPFTKQAITRPGTQLTLDAELFPFVGLILLKFTARNMKTTLAALREKAEPVGLRRGHDVRVTFEGFIKQVAVDLAPNGQGEQGILTFKLMDMIDFEVLPSKDYERASEEGSGSKDPDEPGDIPYGDDFDPALAPPQDEQLPGLGDTGSDSAASDEDKETEPDGLCVTTDCAAYSENVDGQGICIWPNEGGPGDSETPVDGSTECPHVDEREPISYYADCTDDDEVDDGD